MKNTRSKNSVRYFLFLLLFFAFFFFTNDFGLTDVQKSAIVMAVGVDREEEGFILTSQVAIPQSSKQGKAVEAVQLVSRGKTVAEAFEEINAKTGWYPKLVFCNLIVLGKKTAEADVFDVLDFFLRDEYLSDDCQLAVYDGLAKDVLNTTALVDPSSSVAIGKILSAHAERSGTVLPSNLKDFSIGYFSGDGSGLLPVLKKEEQQEKIEGEESKSGGEGNSSGGGSSSSSEGGSGGSGGQQKSGQSEDKPVFSAKQTALFSSGRWVGTLNEEETFAVGCAVGKLRLANYSVGINEERCTFLVRQNHPKVQLEVSKEGKGALKIEITMVAGIVDYSKSQPLEKTKDSGAVVDGAFGAAEKKLASTLITAYEKAKAVGCDVFRIQERLVKYKKRAYQEHKDTLLDDTALDVKVKFKNVR